MTSLIKQLTKNDKLQSTCTFAETTQPTVHHGLDLCTHYLDTWQIFGGHKFGGIFSYWCQLQSNVVD